MSASNSVTGVSPAPVYSDTGYVSLNNGWSPGSPGVPLVGPSTGNSPPTRSTPVSRGQNSILSRSTPVLDHSRSTPQLKEQLLFRDPTPSLKDQRSTPLGSSRQGSASPGDTYSKKLETVPVSRKTPTPGSGRLGSPFWSPAGPQSRTFEFPERDIPLTSSSQPVVKPDSAPTYKHVTNLLIDKVTHVTHVQLLQNIFQHLKLFFVRPVMTRYLAPL